MNQLIVANDKRLATQDSVIGAIAVWASSNTDADSERFDDMLRDKTRDVSDFFAFTNTQPGTATPQDVERWLDDMRERRLATSTIYARASFLSSFYDWLLASDERLRAGIGVNPVNFARQKPPKAYKGVKSLSDEELDELLRVVREEANAGSLTAKRDYAMLLFYILTGHRCEEVCRLRWSDLKRTNGTVLVYFLTKGGDYVTEEVSVACYDALLDYLEAADRTNDMEQDTPLWTGHDRAKQATGQLSSHAFAKNLKRYARDAGLEHIHVHQLRHTVARMVGEDTGDMTQVQKVLGHKNLATTRVYLSQVATKKDTHSAAIRARLNL